MNIRNSVCHSARFRPFEKSHFWLSQNDNAFYLMLPTQRASLKKKGAKNRALLKTLLLSSLTLFNVKVWSLPVVVPVNASDHLTPVNLNNKGQQANMNWQTFQLTTANEVRITNLNGLFTFNKNARGNINTRLDTPLGGSLHALNHGLRQAISKPDVISLKGVLSELDNHKTVLAQMTIVSHGNIRDFAVDFDGDELIRFEIPLHQEDTHQSNANRLQVKQNINKGVIIHPDVARGIMTKVINLASVKEATRVTMVDGAILLHTADTVIRPSKALEEVKTNPIVEQLKQVYGASKTIGFQIRRIYMNAWGVNAGTQGELNNALNCTDGSVVCAVNSSMAAVEKASVSSEHFNIQTPMELEFFKAARPE